MEPQICMIIVFALTLGIELALHGQPQTGVHNFWMSLLDVLAIALILHSGKFWHVFASKK